MSSANASAPFEVMKAAVATDFATPASSKIQVATMPTPVVGDPDDVLIKVKAASLNPVDFKIVQGHLNSIIPVEKPFRLGFDLCGTVEKVGGGVVKFKVGDEVYSRVGHLHMGTLSTYALTPQNTVALKPKTISVNEAAAVPLAAQTALQALRDVGQTKPGDRVLILGGGGGVGTFAIQIAKHVLGASEVITTVGASSITQAATLGATQTIDYKKEKFSDVVKDIDVVLDTTGEANAAFSVVKSGGRVVSLIAPPTVAGFERSGVQLSLTTKAMMAAAATPALANAALHGAVYEYLFMKPSSTDLTDLAKWIDDGKIKVVVDSTFPLSQIKQAFDRLEEGHAKGKIVITID